MVAEGVETYEQLQKNQSTGCKAEIQGFYYYRPIPAANVLRCLTVMRVVQKYHKNPEPAEAGSLSSLIANHIIKVITGDSAFVRHHLW